MEGKPRFSGVSPESDQSLGPEVSQWREKLGEGPWAGTEPKPADKSEANQEAIIQEPKPVVAQTETTKTQPTETAETPKAAINEALTDSNADIADVQSMMEHFFEENKNV